MTTTNGDLRPARTTANLRLPVPGDADPMDPPTDIGALADVLDLLADRIKFQPGDLKFSASPQPGPGWLFCDGRAVGRAAYPELFAAIQTIHGGGDGSTTFNLPNYVGQVLVGAGGGALGPWSLALGSRGGLPDVLLNAWQSGTNPNGGTGWQSADHTHNIGDDWPDHWHGIGALGWVNHYRIGDGPFDVWVGNSHTPWGTGGASNRHTHPWPSGVTANHWHALSGRDADHAHTNVQPFATANVFIKT